MALLDSGLAYYVARAIGESVLPLNNANAHIGVGDDSTPVVPEQTTLQATVNKFFAGMDGGFPTRVGTVVTFQAIFGPSDANYVWEEWVIANAATGGTCLVRVADYVGTKIDGQTWIFRVVLDTRIGT